MLVAGRPVLEHSQRVTWDCGFDHGEEPLRLDQVDPEALVLYDRDVAPNIPTTCCGPRFRSYISPRYIMVYFGSGTAAGRCGVRIKYLYCSVEKMWQRSHEKGDT